MHGSLSIKFRAKDKKVLLGLAVCVLTFILFTVLQDALRSGIKNTAFYLSESLLFSSFWWCFAPLLFAQYYAVDHTSKRSVTFQLLLTGLPAAIHLFAFPFLVWLLSGLFYYHTYAFQQIFKYALSEHVYNLAVLYTIPVMTYQFFVKRLRHGAVGLPALNTNNTSGFIDAILVTSGNKKLPLAVAEIFYFAASAPYISIYTNDKKYLQQETLRSISGKLDPAQFVRIHRSTIINISLVSAYTSRLNGDYDLTLKNNVQLRVSRNYAADFKKLFHQAHQLTAK
jgi:hypothetical protein